MSTVRVGRYTPTDPRLGRHVVHDERSRRYAIAATPKLPTEPVMHERHIPILDQGQLGSCTANAGLGMLASGPLWRHTDPEWNEQDAVALYSEETRLDDRSIPGRYPPDDTGSAGIYLCRALRSRGLITSYWHAFSTRSLLGMLGRQPCAIGIPWLESMFEPRPHGTVVVDRRSAVAGGHEVCVDGIDPRRKLVRFAQSWGAGWGDLGWGWLSWDDLEWLLSQDGDAVTVTRSTG